MVGASRAKQPTVAPKAATSHMDVLCLRDAQEDTEVKRQKTVSKPSAERKQTGMTTIRAGVPRISGTMSALATTGTFTFCINALIATAG